MVSHRCMFNLFFSKIDETWLVMKTSSDVFADFGDSHNFQIGSTITGTHVGFSASASRLTSVHLIPFTAVIVLNIHFSLTKTEIFGHDRR